MDTYTLLASKPEIHFFLSLIDLRRPFALPCWAPTATVKGKPDAQKGGQPCGPERAFAFWWDDPWLRLNFMRTGTPLVPVDC